MIFEKKVSSLITISKVFALISIVCAHITFIDETPYVIQKIYSAFASVGVICFLFCSAYYFPSSTSKGTFIDFWKRKAVTIGLPWLFLGSISYLYNAILSKNLSILGYIKWILGNGTYLYFMTVLVLCFLIFYRTNNVILFSAIGINLVSLMLTAAGLLDNVISALHITNYLNIFNWIGIFAIGILVSRIDAEKFFKFLKNTRFIFLGFFIFAAALVCIFDVTVGYFSFVGIWLEVLGCLAILGISTIDIFEHKLMYDISNLSFTIYLIHMIVIGVFDRIYTIHPILSALAVFIVICICYLLLTVAKLLIKVIKLEKYLFPLFGFRSRNLKSKNDT